MGAKKLNIYNEGLALGNERKLKNKLNIREVWKKLWKPLLRAILASPAAILAVLNSRVVREIAPGRYEELNKENLISEQLLRVL
ncbi:MAG: hypothetical protein HRT45_06415 [Bdellovibrionales bacterium]|nr:hypothetical protein [Bdellovibrionales bacterium]